MTALHRSIEYFSQRVADGGAYKRTYDLSLSQRDPLGNQPETADVGLAYISAYEATGDPAFLGPAKAIARLLEQTQLGNTGGWWHDLYTSAYGSGSGGRLFYRSDAEAGKKAPDHSDYSVYRDDATPSALRFLMRLDAAEGRHDAGLRHVIDYGLAGLLAGAYQPSGGYPDVYDTCRDPVSIRCKVSFPVERARIPADWPTTWPGTDVDTQTQYYSLNDGTTPLVIETLLEAWRYSGRQAYRAAAVKAANWLLRAQFPEPQPGWSQVYDADMSPRWDRIYEPPALSTRETASAVRTLLHVYRLTGTPAYKASAQRASQWLTRVGFTRSGNGGTRWPMFVEFRSNKPVFVDNSGNMTTDWSAADDWPNYGFLEVEDLGLIAAETRTVDARSCTQTAKQRAALAARMRPRAAAVARSLDGEGRWVTNGRISTETFSENVQILAAYLGLLNNRKTYLDAQSIVRHLVTPRDDPCRYLAGRGSAAARHVG